VLILQLLDPTPGRPARDRAAGGYRHPAVHRHRGLDSADRAAWRERVRAGACRAPTCPARRLLRPWRCAGHRSVVCKTSTEAPPGSAPLLGV